VLGFRPNWRDLGRVRGERDLSRDGYPGEVRFQHELRLYRQSATTGKNTCLCRRAWALAPFAR
jgi:hypothetical protein